MYLTQEKILSDISNHVDSININIESSNKINNYKPGDKYFLLIDKVYGKYSIIIHNRLRTIKHKNRRTTHNKLQSNLVFESILLNSNFLDIKESKKYFIYKSANEITELVDVDFGRFSIRPRKNKSYEHPKRKKNYQPTKYEAFDWLMNSSKCTKYIDKVKSKLVFEYVNNLQQVKLFDIEYGEFYIRPVDFKKGVQHKSRSKYGIDLNKSTYLYLLTINNSEQYKIGITNRNPKDRYKVWEQSFITNILSTKFKDGFVAHNIEKDIIETFKSSLIKKQDMILDSGYTETFNKLNIPKELKKYERFKILFE